MTYNTIVAWEDAQNSQETSYQYSDDTHPDKLAQTVYPDAGTVTLTFNTDGTVASNTNQRNTVFTYDYDAAKRPVTEYADSTARINYAYDALGRLTSLEETLYVATVSWTYTREADGDLEVEETQSLTGHTDRTVTTLYDLAGRLKSLTYPSGLALTYDYDDPGRAVSVNDGTYDRVADTYAGGLLERRDYANGAYLSYLDDNGENLSGFGYDQFGRIKNRRWLDSEDDLIAGWSHAYDRMGNKSYQEDLWDSTESELYGYDAVYRLTGFERGQLNQNKDDIVSPTRSQTWALDPLGNWGSTVLDSVTESRVHSDVNELTSRTVGQNPAINLAYDDAGNLTQDGTSDGAHQYVWDCRNRLMQVKERQSGNWVTVADYKFDALNRRVRRSVSNKGALNGVTRFVYGGDSDWQCLEERGGADGLVARYTYSPGYIDAVAVQERDLNADSDLLDTSEVVYYHANTLFSPYALTDASGTVLERYRYDAYGQATVLDADGSDDADNASDVGNPYLLTGRSLDRESGLVYYRNRQYSPSLGRFVSRDPTDYMRERNLYCYASDRPTFSGDPMGLRTAKECECYCKLLCAIITNVADVVGGGAACEVYCQALCTAPDPGKPCYNPKSIMDCAISCQSRGGCNVCCGLAFKNGVIDTEGLDKCALICKQKPTYPD